MNQNASEWAIYCTILTSVILAGIHFKHLFKNFQTNAESAQEFREMISQNQETFEQAKKASHLVGLFIPFLFSSLLYESGFAIWFILLVCGFFIISQFIGIQVQNKIIQQHPYTSTYYWIGKAESAIICALMLWVIGGLFVG
jgi:hypothetical protein